MRAVLYLRMSRDEQERSIGGQRDALAEYAKKKGYSIVAEYADEGISGDATEKRLQFQQMMADCTKKNFELILAWDQDRFGRFDPLEAGYWVKPMRDAGVVLETIAQGRIDWNDFAGRLIWSVSQEGKHGFLRDLAKNSLRGNLARAKEGKTIGPAPFGYARGEDGRYVLGDPTEIAAVRRAFDLRALGHGYNRIAKILAAEGMPCPATQWAKEAVRTIIMRESYTGTFVYGTRNCGKYQTTIGGVIVQQTSTIKLNRDPLRVVGSHPAIISQEQWEAAQRQKRDPPKKRGVSGKSAAPLTGLLYCECGAAMYAWSITSRDEESTYICGRYHKAAGCGRKCITRREIHHIVSETIRAILGPSKTALVKRLKQVAASRPLKDIAPLQRQLAKLNKSISQASERILSCNQRLVVDLEKKLLAMQDDRDRLQAEIEAARQLTPKSAEQLAAPLWKLRDIFESNDPAFIRSSLKQCFSKIVLRFEVTKQTRLRTSYRYVSGTAYGVSGVHGWMFSGGHDLQSRG